MLINYILLTVLTVIMSVATIFGFVTIGSPFEIRNERLDSAKVDVLGKLALLIDKYYTTNNKLPNKLDDVIATDGYLIGNELALAKEQEYRPGSGPNYQLCSSFLLASKPRDLNIPPRSISSLRFDHPKGNYCFDLVISGSNSVLKDSLQTPTSINSPSTPTIQVSPSPSQATPVSSDQGQNEVLSLNTPNCMDSDLNNSDEKYISGSVEFKDSNGNTKIYQDECSGSKQQVNEYYCYKLSDNPIGLMGTKVHNCPKGCINGACVR